jgi:hypothetical protein
MPPLQDRAPLQVVLHWSPEQAIPTAQLSGPAQVICALDALLLMGPRHAESAQVI